MVRRKNSHSHPPDLGGSGGGSAHIAEQRIRHLINDQLFGILCTQSDGQPYGSLVAFAHTEDLKHVVFATPRATKKYELLTTCSNVALVVQDMNRHPDDLMSVEAFTATGRATELVSREAKVPWADLLVQRHPYLKAFVTSPSTALFRIDIARYYFVSSFQSTQQWVPDADDS